MLLTSRHKFRYANPTTGEISPQDRAGWIPFVPAPHKGAPEQIGIRCALHGGVHETVALPPLVTHGQSRYALTLQDFGCALLAASCGTRARWQRAFARYEDGLKFDWTSPVRTHLLAARALAAAAPLRTVLSRTAGITVPASVGTDPQQTACFVIPRSGDWEYVYDLTPTSRHILATLTGSLGLLLAHRHFGTCEEMQRAYAHLRAVFVPPDEEESGVEDTPEAPMRAYLHAARVLHEFLAAPAAYTIARALEALPAFD